MTFREVPIGAAFDVRNGATPASGELSYWDGDIPWVGPADLGKLRSRFVERGERSITPEGYASCGTQMVPEGTIILSIRAPIGHMAIASRSMCFNQGCRGLVPRPMIRTDFAYWALLGRKPQLEAAGQGTTFIELGRHKLRAERIPLPNLETQKAITDFLDRETARIDQLMEKKKRFANVLDKKISDFADVAVVEGLNRSQAKRSTEIPWLPEIPTHWQLKRAKYLFREVSRAPRNDDGIITAFRDGQVTLREKRRTDGYTFAVLEVGYQHIKRGDLVIHTMDAFAGAIGVSEDDGKSTGEYAVCEAINPNTNNMYYAHALRCMARRDYIYVLCPSVRERAPRFRFVRFAPIFLPVPPFEEQNRIVETIENQTTRLRHLRDYTVLSIKRLREFRSALITGAVTGQIDIAVRNNIGTTDRRLDKTEEEMGALASDHLEA